MAVKSIAATATHLLQSSRARRWLQVALAALVLLFFGRALYEVAPRLLSYNWQLDPTYLLISLLIMLARGPIGAYGWWAIVRRLGYPLTWAQSLRLVSISSVAGFVPGSMWHAVSRVYLADKEGMPRLTSVMSMGIETVMVLLGALIVASLSLIGWHDAPVWGGVALLAALLAMVLQPQLLFRVLNWALVRLKRKPVEVQLSARDMLALLWPYLLNWLLYGVMSFAIVAALYPQLSIAYLPVTAGIFTASWAIGYLVVFVPQGWGVREVIITTVLAGLLGLPVAVAAGAALLSRGWSIVGVALWGAVAAMGLGTRD
ncbi:MAG: flippase-like domain-containing protein [Chloroflexi bacterium]|nr:flippase-like domain-containing protein [Chloroflexota bacterium]